MLREAVKRAAQKEIPLPLDSLYLDWQIVRDNGKEMAVFVGHSSQSGGFHPQNSQPG